MADIKAQIAIASFKKDVRKATVDCLGAARLRGLDVISPGISPTAFRSIATLQRMLITDRIRFSASCLRSRKDAASSAHNPTESEKLSLIAVGIPGAARWKPYSDVAVSTPYKITPWAGERYRTGLYAPDPQTKRSGTPAARSRIASGLARAKYNSTVGRIPLFGG
jgi:hypothetical protein